MGGVDMKPSGEKKGTLELIVVGLGVWCSFMVFGWAQEALTSKEGYGEEKERFKFTNFLVLLQSVGNTLVALVLLYATEGSKAKLGGGVPTKDWLVVALGYLGAHEFGLASLTYIIFPIQVVLKSCKAIPVMLGETIFAGKKHPPAKIMAVVLMCVGVAIFMLGKGAKKGKGKSMDDFDLYSSDTAFGIMLVMCALVCDGVYGPYQNKIVKAHNAKVDAAKGSDLAALSPYHLMFNMNAWQGVFALLICFSHGDELTEVRHFVAKHPEIIPRLAAFSGTMALGNVFIYRLQRYWGSLTVTLTTTMRKLGSVLFSVVRYGHPIAGLQWVGICIVFLSKPLGSVLAAAFTSRDAEPAEKAKKQD